MATIEEELINTARRYGMALERLENALHYKRSTKLPDDIKVEVSWNWGSGTRGYKELSELVSQFAANSMKSNLEAAIQTLRVQARDAGAELDRLRAAYLKEL